MLFKNLLALLLLLFGVLFPLTGRTHPLEEDSSALVILAYSRIGEDYAPQTNLQTNQFKDQLNFLLQNNFHILSIKDALEAYTQHKTLPPKAIIITFEGGYKSALKEAIPLLLSKNIPFTVFYAAESAASNSSTFMNWDDLKKLKQNKNVTLGVLPATYSRLAGQPKSEILAEMIKAKAKHREMFHEEPVLFSYPYGEYDINIKDIVIQHGYLAALGLNAGATSIHSDLYALPRFPITEDYGDMDHFKTIVNALPLPVTDLEPQNPRITNPYPTIGFNIPTELKDFIGDLKCFVSDQQKPSLEILGDTRVELRLNSPLQENRTRINCIMPVTSKEAEEKEIRNWRWLGLLLVYPDAAIDTNDSL